MHLPLPRSRDLLLANSKSNRMSKMKEIEEIDKTITMLMLILLINKRTDLRERDQASLVLVALGAEQLREQKEEWLMKYKKVYLQPFVI